MRQHERDVGKHEWMTTPEKERIKALERKVRELRQVRRPPVLSSSGV